MLLRLVLPGAVRALRPLLLAGLLPLAAACDNDDDPALSTAPPDQVSFTQAGLYPEGSEFDGTTGRYAGSNNFLVSSQTAGCIGRVDNSGNYSVLADDPSLISSIGLRIDRVYSRLLVAVSDPGYNAARTSATTKGKLAGLAIFNPHTGAFAQYVNLGALRPSAPGHFANDVDVDNLGNAYVTDSYAPLLYKVSLQGVATVLLEDPALAAPAGTFGLNGLVYHPSNYLLVAKSDEGKLLKVTLGSPAGFAAIALPAGLSLAGADGLRLLDNTTLLVACNAQGRVYRLTSADGFASISGSTFFSTGAVYPTTLSLLNGEPYVLYSHLNALQSMQSPPASQFSLTRVKF